MPCGRGSCSERSRRRWKVRPRPHVPPARDVKGAAVQCAGCAGSRLQEAAAQAESDLERSGSERRPPLRNELLAHAPEWARAARVVPMSALAICAFAMAMKLLPVFVVKQIPRQPSSQPVAEAMSVRSAQINPPLHPLRISREIPATAAAPGGCSPPRHPTAHAASADLGRSR